LKILEACERLRWWWKNVVIVIACPIIVRVQIEPQFVTVLLDDAGVVEEDVEQGS
jgi:hypothetical protein